MNIKKEIYKANIENLTKMIKKKEKDIEKNKEHIIELNRKRKYNQMMLDVL